MKLFSSSFFLFKISIPIFLMFSKQLVFWTTSKYDNRKEKWWGARTEDTNQTLEILIFNPLLCHSLLTGPWASHLVFLYLISLSVNNSTSSSLPNRDVRDTPTDYKVLSYYGNRTWIYSRYSAKYRKWIASFKVLCELSSDVSHTAKTLLEQQWLCCIKKCTVCIVCDYGVFLDLCACLFLSYITFFVKSEKHNR